MLIVAADLSMAPTSRPALWAQSVSAIIISVVALGLWGFIRWCRCWRNFRRMLLGAAIMATLATVFYTEEYWRGKRAWDTYRHELEAKGAVLDWEKLIPAPVPDDQNFFMASTNIRIRFSKSQTEAQTRAATNLTWLNPSYNDLPSQRFSRTNAPLVAELIMVPMATPTTGSVASLSVRLDDPARAEKIQNVFQATLGRSVIGASSYHFSEYDLSRLQPAWIYLATDSTPSADDLTNLIPPNVATNIGQLKLEATADPKVFQVKLVSGSITPAAQYLAWSDRLAPDFDEIREALKRPYAMIPGDYSEPYLIPIPNFVTMRWLAQTLAQRVQCHLLLGEPEKALPDLTLIHDICRILEHRPTGKPMTLVEAMINVAITGLYTETIKEGLRTHCWQEPELATLQAQFKEINLRPYIDEAFRDERVHTVRLGERTNFEKLLTGELFGYNQKKLFYEKLGQRVTYGLMPQGWVFQNIRVATELNQKILDALAQSDEQIYPKKIEQANLAMSSVVEHWTVFRLLASIAVPNFTKAFQTYARNQTGANQAQIVCALERYHLARGGYPEALDALTPQFMDKIPVDIIGGEPLHYRRTNDGKFLLYSVGWNETDDGGSGNGSWDVKTGDWVWQN